MFRTQFDPHPRVLSNAGSRIRKLYSAKVDAEGAIALVESGEENLYDYIQSFKDECDINLIVQRCMSGDVDVLSKRQGVYADVTEFPQTYAEVLQRVIDGKNAFDDLPLEVRAKFDHSFAQWMAAMDDMPDWLEKMGMAGVSADADTQAVPAADGVVRAEGSAEGGSAE